MRKWAASAPFWCFRLACEEEACTRHDRVVESGCRPMFLLQFLCWETAVPQWDRFIMLSFSRLEPPLTSVHTSSAPVSLHSVCVCVFLLSLSVYCMNLVLCSPSLLAFILSLCFTPPSQTCKTQQGVALTYMRAVLVTVARIPQSTEERVIAVWVSKQVCVRTEVGWGTVHNW